MLSRSLLKASGLTRRPWFEGLDLQLEEGEIRVLMGASGAGKTLLLRALADLDAQAEGEVWLEGRRREEHSPAEWRARVMLVPAAGARLGGDAIQNVREVTSLAIHAGREPSLPQGLAHDTPADQLSSGELARLALHRALLLEPRVLLLDEPCAHLDAPAARAVEQSLCTWAHAGRAILWVSHDATLAARLGAGEALVLGAP